MRKPRSKEGQVARRGEVGAQGLVFADDTVAKRLILVRRYLGKKQTEMAELIGIHVTTLSLYERGIREPGSAEMQPLAGTGLNLDWLLTGKGDIWKVPRQMPEWRSSLHQDIPPANVKLLDEGLLVATVQALEEWLSANDKHLAPEKKGEAVVALYLWGLKDKAAEQSGAQILTPASSVIERFVKMAS